MDRGAWWATDHGVAKSWTWLSTQAHTHTYVSWYNSTYSTYWLNSESEGPVIWVNFQFDMKAGSTLRAEFHFTGDFFFLQYFCQLYMSYAFSCTDVILYNRKRYNQLIGIISNHLSVAERHFIIFNSHTLKNTLTSGKQMIICMIR